MTFTRPAALVGACALVAAALVGAVATTPAAAAPLGGSPVGWGDNRNAQLGINSTDTPVTVPTSTLTSGILQGKTLVEVTAGDAHACAIDTAGRAYCWGVNTHGEVGNGNVGGVYPAPVAVSTAGVLAGKQLVHISAGFTNTCAVDSSGQAYCWGYGSSGILGNGTGSSTGAPVAVTQGSERYSTISVGDSHVCATRSDTLGISCWGTNTSGQVSGVGSTNKPRAVQGLPLSEAVSVAAGSNFTCSVFASGVAYCWGNNSAGQLGDGNAPTASSTPRKVVSNGVLSGRTLVSVAASFAACALDSTGAAFCWGSNSYGMAGDGALGNNPTPVAVFSGGALAGRTLASIATRYLVTCATDTLGAAYCWGNNPHSLLGPATSDQYSLVPVKVTPTGALVGRRALTAAVGGTHDTGDRTLDTQFVLTLATHPLPKMTLGSPQPGTLRLNVNPDKPYGQQWQVSLQRKVGSQWKAAVALGPTTGSTSVRDFRYLPSGTYRAWVAAKPGFSAGYSTAFSYTAKKISATISVYSGTGLRVRVTPVLDGSAAWQVGFQRKSGSSWVSAGSCFTSGATETCSKDLPAGTYRVVIARGAGYLGYTSGSYAVPS